MKKNAKKAVKKATLIAPPALDHEYSQVLAGMIDLLEDARRKAARATHSVMTATYREVGRRITEHEQQGTAQAKYGEQVIDRLAEDLTARFGRGFRRSNLFQMTALPKPEDAVASAEEINDPLVLEFLGLKDEYAESNLEEALIRHLESFLLEFGQDFTVVGRQKRLRIGNSWFRIDLLFYHRRLRCLLIVDLKRGKFDHADAGQMHLYLNYAQAHWTHPDENPPVGLILCSEQDDAVARYALDGLPNKVMAAEYRTILPDEQLLAEELRRTRRLLSLRAAGVNKSKKKR